MFSRRLKRGYFALEGLNSFATVYYFYYLYFYMQQVYGFGNKANLLLASLNGATYALMAWFGGKFAQQYGYFRALKVGYAIMIVALGLGLLATAASFHVAVMVLVVVGMSFTWPTLEALVSEGEPRAGLQHMVGIYNVVWAATAALGNFSGGAMLQKLGMASLFYVPMAVHVTQLALTFWLESKATVPADSPALPAANSSSNGRKKPDGNFSALGPKERDNGIFPSNKASSAHQKNVPGHLAISTPTARAEFACSSVQRHTSHALGLQATQSGEGDEPSRGYVHFASEGEFIPKAKRFLRMAWLANPFAYIAINTLIAIIPGVARRLELSTMAAGFCCSTWCFARLGAFALLWRWTAWHYRFRWLLCAYLGLIASFAAVVLAPRLAVLVMAQVIFGAAVGLIYYSSLFYSMDRSETKGEHGGIHEAAIGLGNCAGPAVGAAALQLLPQQAHSGIFAVIVLLLSGLVGLMGIWLSKSDRDNLSGGLRKTIV